MAGMSIGGIASGLDTETIINQLISVERNSQTLLKQKLTQQNEVVSALQGLNARAASLLTGAAALADPQAWTKVGATSSSSSVAVSTSNATGSGSLTFTVVQTASKASYTTAPVLAADAPQGEQRFTITSAKPGATPVDVVATSGAPADLAKAINAAGAGVVATTIQDASGAQRLLVTSATSGEQGDFSFGGAQPPALAAQLTPPRDAALDLGAGTFVRSATNTFPDLMAGVSVTISKVEDAPVTVTAAPDTAAVAKRVGGMVASLGVVLSEIADQTRSSVDDPGLLAGNSLLRGLQQQLVSAVSTAVPGATLKDVGIELTRQGTVTFDEAAFSAYAAKEPDRAKALTTAFSSALAGVARRASDSTTGTISLAVTSGQSTARDLTTRIEAWDTRLELRRASLERTYAALEVALQKNQSQSSWLAGALAGLPTYSS
ncbi:flagellar filament capping protein FliD [Quadrisphaera sp. DSM 44207]|uniref:flagellar filament capping protein FliD n=1 Tax=Quadrisphaera sp. DSM 44207 TaxID=1881057 RepID=UPI000890FF41|nr:flagellar filament capping protein FliD [Quadrisphaera sp. DSM 44207]SDQ20273.1 flagellar hook-associated protein 2 [Quadrisphaera sp. DSM 44207]